MVNGLNQLLEDGRLDRSTALKTLDCLKQINGVFQILDLEEDATVDMQIAELLYKRDQARARKDWPEADRIRSQLAEMGIRVVDTPKGSVWVREGKR